MEFIAAMERRGIGRLFTSGIELATRLTARGPSAIKPELQLIELGMRDDTIGVLLQDVWRYARHFWSIPYQSTPGRNLFYLVRDAALPERPLIGTGALGNPVWAWPSGTITSAGQPTGWNDGSTILMSLSGSSSLLT